MKNSHSLRKKYDARNPMWTQCITVLKDDALRHQEQAKAFVRQEVSWRYYIVTGKKGILLREGTPFAENPEYLVTKSGCVIGIPMLESEFPLRKLTEEMLVMNLLTSPDVRQVYVRELGKRLLGLMLGDINQHFSALVYLDDTAQIQIKDIETCSNARNNHEVCAFTGVKVIEQKAVIEGFTALLNSKKGAVKARVPHKEKR